MNRLWVRLSLAFLVVMGLAIGMVTLIVLNATESSFRTYVKQSNAIRFDSVVVSELQDFYAQTGSWQGAESLLPGPKQDGAGGHGRGNTNTGRGPGVVIADLAGKVIVATDPELVGIQLDDNARDDATPLIVDENQVGWLAQESRGTQALGETEQAFLDEVTDRLVGVAIVAALLAVLTGAALSWHVTRHLRTLTEAAHGLAAGNLGHQVEAQGTTEISELAQAFNTMSRDLAEGEILRQRMAADIAHELRTPVSVLRGHLEAMLDGVFPLDGEHLAVAYDRTIHLSRLVDDLRLLTRAETGHLSLEQVPTAPDDLATRAVESFAPLALDAGIRLQTRIAPGLPPVYVDVDRMQQVLGNLLTNALRHTSSNGQITLQVTRQGDQVQFGVSNTGSELTAEQAQNVFKPFWRAEDARERDRGGSGLGLAITRQLVALHGGRIWVESDSGVTTFAFGLPIHTVP